MGIPSCRFTVQNHEQFVCTVCLDVSEDPIVVNDCEHIFCRRCIENDGLVKCPTCQEPFKEPKWSELKGLGKRIYLDMKIKCLNPSCDHVLDATNFADHDGNCSITFAVCDECGFKNKRSSNDVHSCAKEIKRQFQLRSNEELLEMKQELKSELEGMWQAREEQFTLKLNQQWQELLIKQRSEMKNELQLQFKQEFKKEFESQLVEQRNELKEKFRAERKRYEDLIAGCVAYRNLFQDWENDPDHHYVRCLKKRDLRDRVCWQIHSIIKAYDEL